MIQRDVMEFNKPSELTQIIFVDRISENYNLVKIIPSQLDLLNVLYYKSKEFILKHNMHIDIAEASTMFEFTLLDLTNALNIYKNYEYKHILTQLDKLSDIKIVINTLGKNNDIDELIITRFIHEIRISKHKNSNKKKIKLWLSNFLINRFLNVKKYFSKMFFQIQYNMNSKYSKLLYELLKDYQGIKIFTIDFNNIVLLLNVVEPKQTKWTLFHQNILKKAIKEINEKSDIKVSYEPIKERPNGGRLQVMKIKFFIEEQDENRLKELGLLDQEEELSIEDQILMNKAELIYENLPKFRKDKINDKDAYVKSIFKKDYDKLKDELRLDDWINEMINDIEIKSNQPQTLSILIGNNVYAINDNYIIVDLDTNKYLTSDATETIKFINDIINKDHSIELLEIGNKHEFSKSSINLI